MGKQLTDRQVQTSKLPGGQSDYFIADRDGLYLRLRPGTNGVRKSWLYRFTFQGEKKKLSLGSYADMTLAEARELVTAKRKLVKDGVNPIELRRQEKAQAFADSVATKTGDKPPRRAG
jgi:hypothetical protein